MGDGKIVLVFPHNGRVLHPKFSDSMDRWREYDLGDRKLYAGKLSVPGLFIDNNRNALAKAVLERDAEWSLWLDTDIAFEVPVPYALLDAPDAVERPIISAFFITYLTQGLWICWMKQHGNVYR